MGHLKLEKSNFIFSKEKHIYYKLRLRQRVTIEIWKKLFDLFVVVLIAFLNLFRKICYQRSTKGKKNFKSHKTSDCNFDQLFVYISLKIKIDYLRAFFFDSSEKFWNKKFSEWLLLFTSTFFANFQLLKEMCTFFS